MTERKVNVSEIEKTDGARTTKVMTWPRTKTGYTLQGDYLGETLIMLADGYEGSQADCDYVELAANSAPALCACLRSVRAMLPMAAPCGLCERDFDAILARHGIELGEGS